jgi:hypothetical protein
VKKLARSDDLIAAPWLGSSRPRSGLATGKNYKGAN